MNKFSGVVISGKNAGKFYSVESPYLKIPIISEIKEFYSECEEFDYSKSTFDVEKYKHVRMQWHNNGTDQDWIYGFWVPVDIINPQPFVIEKLLENYKK